MVFYKKLRNLGSSYNSSYNNNPLYAKLRI